MIAQDVVSHEAVTFDDLRPLAAASGPCLTMSVPLPNPAEIAVRLKNAIRGVQKKLAEFGIDDKHSASLMAPIQEFATIAETDRVWGPRDHPVAFTRPVPVLHAARAGPGGAYSGGAFPGAAPAGRDDA